MMQAIEISEFGDADVLKPCTRPIPVASGFDVVIKAFGAGVNRPDCLQRQGKYKIPDDASDLPGLEVAGKIIAMGDDAQTTKLFNIGDNIMALTPGGGYAQYVKTDIRHCLAIPDSLTMQDAAVIPETFFTVWGNLFMRGHFKANERVLIHGGSSGIGTTAIQLVKAFGGIAYTTVSHRAKQDLCLQIGADHVIRYDQQDWAEEMTKLGGVDIILDMVGGDYVKKGIAVLNKYGRYLLIASLGGTKAEFDIRQLMPKRLTITGSTLRPQSRQEKADICQELQKYVMPLWQQGLCQPQLNHQFDLNDAHKAHALMESGQHLGKILLNIHHDD